MSDQAFTDWETRVAAVWKIADTLTPQELVRTIDQLASERPADDTFALFERACARDTAGIEDGAEPLYRAALASGALDAYRHARASIQLGSTLRHLGRLDESEQLLQHLYRQAAIPEYQCRFRWEPDSLALWDNRCVQHYAVSDYWPHRRAMERVTIVGDRPV